MNLNGHPSTSLLGKKANRRSYLNYFNSLKSYFSNNQNTKHLGIYDLTYRSDHMIQNQTNLESDISDQFEEINQIDIITNLVKEINSEIRDMAIKESKKSIR